MCIWDAITLFETVTYCPIDSIEIKNIFWFFFYRNYDIFVKSTESKDDSKLICLERCHGCLRLTFCGFLFLIVLFTAFISRMAFHVIMINLNPPTIFTTMNKFGGDIVNKTLAFVPAQVHFSWMWACFFVLIAPSVHSFVYHMGQQCRKKNLDVYNTDEENMHFLIQSPDNEYVNIFNKICKGNSKESIILNKNIIHQINFG